MLDKSKPETLVAQVRDALFLEVKRHCPDIKEKPQRQLEERLTQVAHGLVADVTGMVLAGSSGWVNLAARLSRIADLDKQAQVTLVLEDPDVDWTSLHRAKHTGVTLLLADAGQFDRERPAAPIDPDQPTIFHALDRTEARREPARDRFVTVHMDGRPSELWCDEFNRVMTGSASLVQSVSEYLNDFERRRGALETREGIDAIVRARYGDVKFTWDNPAAAAVAPEATGPAPVREPDEDDPEEDEEGEENGDELDAIEELIGPAAEPDPNAFDLLAELVRIGVDIRGVHTAEGVNVRLPITKANVKLLRTGDGHLVPVVKSISGRRVASDVGHDTLEKHAEYRRMLEVLARANEAALQAVPVPEQASVA